MQKNSCVGVLVGERSAPRYQHDHAQFSDASYTHVHFLYAIPANRNWLEEMAFYDSNANTGMGSFSN